MTIQGNVPMEWQPIETEGRDMNMVEAVAKAIYESQPDQLLMATGQAGMCVAHPIPWAVIDEKKHAEMLVIGRAAIAAMREPTEAMLEAEVEAYNGLGEPPAVRAGACLWKAMIDTSLKEPK